MKLIRGLHNLKSFSSRSLVTLGNFDGLHLGHQQLIHSLDKLKKQYDLPVVVITFEPQPKEFFLKKTVARLMRFSEKYWALKKLGVDYLCCLYFDEALAGLSAADFVKTILIDKFRVHTVVIGHDFRFGAGRSGDFSLLQAMGVDYQFAVQRLAPFQLNGNTVSSTGVRQALHHGDMPLARQLLGEYYSVRGKVSYGAQRGRDLGFPTANINLHRDLVPLSGVFVIRARLEDEVFNGVANVGIRPTFNGTRVLLEAHLFDFDRNIYGENLQVEFLHKLRNEQRYEHFSDLLAQIKLDVEQGRQYFAHNF